MGTFVAHGRFLLPAPTPAATARAAADLLVPHGGRERLLVRILRRAPALAAMLWRRPAMTPANVAAWQQRRELLREALEALSPAVRIEATGCVLLGDHEGRGGVTAFVPSEAGLATVVKARPTGGADALANEWEALRRLSSTLPPRLVATLPAPLAFRTTPQVQALALGACHGRSMASLLHAAWRPAALPPRHLPAAVDWLADFHAATTRSGPSWSSHATAHGDFWAGNLLLDSDGRVSGVVDWERSGTDRAPWEDLFQLVITYGLNYRWPDRPPLSERLARTFLARGPVSRAVAGALRLYAERRRLPWAELPPLLRRHLLSHVPGAEEASAWKEVAERLPVEGRSVFSG